ncbi:hypothetical protein LGM39_00535 [Burkholderia cepacia]|nr:hypothetical protein [Burkholderia cepacia]MCA7897834.1 hypothetical protein [Burkholderia cepacia]
MSAEVDAARMEDQADMAKKYTTEVNARLVKLVGTVKVKGFSAKAGSNVQSALADDGMTPGPDGLFLTSDDGKVNLLVTTVPLLTAWAKRADEGIKSTNDVAVNVSSVVNTRPGQVTASSVKALREPLGL